MLVLVSRLYSASTHLYCADTCPRQHTWQSFLTSCFQIPLAAKDKGPVIAFYSSSCRRSISARRRFVASFMPFALYSAYETAATTRGKLRRFLNMQQLFKQHSRRILYRMIFDEIRRRREVDLPVRWRLIESRSQTRGAEC